MNVDTSTTRKYSDIGENLDQVITDLFSLIPRSRLSKMINPSQDDKRNYNIFLPQKIDPDKILELTKDTYISDYADLLKDYDGSIGQGDSYTQEDGICSLALLAFLSNKLKNEYVYQKDNADYAKRLQFSKKINESLFSKNNAIQELLSSIYLYERCEEDPYHFSYGLRYDSQGEPSIVIDIPRLGPTCLHFGSTANMHQRKIAATKQAISLFEGKLIGKHPNSPEYKRINSYMNKLQETLSLYIKSDLTQEEQLKLNQLEESDGILPQYTGKFYELSTALPVGKMGETLLSYQKSFEIRDPKDITQEQIKKIAQYSTINFRSKMYLAVKSGFDRSQIESLAKEIDVLTRPINLRQGEISHDTLAKIANSTPASDRAQAGRGDMAAKEDLTHNQSSD